MRRERFGLDEEALRAYFPFDRVEEGVFEMARRLFGVTVTPAPEVDVWHPTVRAYTATAEDGTELGTFYTDWFPRESKRGGAWMNGLVHGGPRADGGFDPHVGVVVGNLTPPHDDAPALLAPDEVRTVFHEYGHLFHQLLTRVPVRARGASAVPWDFIEVPSQIFENWTWTAEGVALYARHYRTGAVPIATYVELQNSYLDAVEALLDTQSETLAAGLKVQQLTGIELNPVEIKP